MNVEEAKKIAAAFDENKMPTEDDVFYFIEAMNYLIEELHDPQDMMYLGGYYYEIKHFDLALKYYEMAAAMDYEPAYECLGYIWYYGRTGEKDFKKAFEYFSRLMDKGDITASYKVADMYKNGYYVEKNIAKYNSIIETLYPKVKNERNLFAPVPEIYTRLARIKTEQGEKSEAVNLYLYAKNFLAQRIKYNGFFGNLSIMKWLIEDLYKLIDFDKDDFNFYDLFFILKTPHKVGFMYEVEEHLIESAWEGGECAICFDGKWYHDRDDFFKKACLGGSRVTAICEEFYCFEVIE